MNRSSLGLHLPLRASGEFLGHRWAYHGEILGDSVRDWISMSGPDGASGAGGTGALPIADLGWKVLGPIGSTGWSPGGWSRRRFRKKYYPGYISGVVSIAVASVRVEFEKQSSAEAMLIDSGHPEYQFFFLPLSPQTRWTHIIALEASGSECDRFARPRDH
jgi:hypothetical protein